VLAASVACLVASASAVSVAAGRPARTHPAHHPALLAGRPPDGMSWRMYHLMQAQQPLDAAAAQIQALSAKPGPAHVGFFETKVEPSLGILTVYWHGPVPANAQRLISWLRAKVEIRVVKTRYSLAALNRAVLTAIHASRRVTGGWPATDGSGIDVGVRRTSARSAASLAAALRSRLGVPVTAVPAGADQLQACAVPGSNTNLGPGSRCDDLENFWGGDVIQSPFVFCTGGFGVHNSSGGEYLLTAAHCAYNGSGYANGITFHNGQTSGSVHYQLVGNITDVPGPHDAAVIPTGTGAQYYDGPGIFNGDTTNTKFVSGQQATSVGDSLCESGAFGGVLCGFIVRQLNVSLPDPDVPSQTWTALALATSGSGTSPSTATAAARGSR
jgi:hypothetical protein